MTSNRGGGGVSDGQVRLLRKHVATLANNNDELMGELNRYMGIIVCLVLYPHFEFVANNCVCDE
jgi:hypothetical protein